MLAHGVGASTLLWWAVAFSRSIAAEWWRDRCMELKCTCWLKLESEGCAAFPESQYQARTIHFNFGNYRLFGSGPVPLRAHSHHELFLTSD